jgi:hypothetical protein
MGLSDVHTAEVTTILKSSLVYLMLVVSSGLVLSLVGVRLVILAAPQHIRDDVA